MASILANTHTFQVAGLILNRNHAQNRIVKNNFIVLCIIILLILCIIEVGAREFGLTDFPIYDVRSEIGYIPQPNQSGAFLNKNVWAFNDRSMGVGHHWSPQNHRNVLLIGNSIVMGGNHYTQDDKLGPLIQKEIGPSYTIWPIAAGGWTNANELVYLNQNPDVVEAAQFFVWEYMAGGLSMVAPWRGDYVWPQNRPLWAGFYLFRRFLVPRLFHVNADELPPTGALDAIELRRFADVIARMSLATGRRTPGILLLYPTKANYKLALTSGEWLPERAALASLAQQQHLLIVDVARDPEWNAALYQDDGVHPTVPGNIVLSHIVAHAIQKEQQ